MGASVKLREFMPAGDTTTPVVGVDDFEALVPVAEPVSMGAPPIAPDLVRQLTAGLPVRSVRSVSGHRVSSAADVSGRPKVELRWTGITATQAGSLREFLDGDCGGGVSPFDVDLDGSGDVVSVIATGPVGMTLVQVGAGDAEDVYSASVEAVQTV